MGVLHQADVSQALSQFFDYAGLFPPAGLAMSPCQQNFERYLNSSHSNLLSAFVLPASRLGEFSATFKHFDRSTPWKLSVLCGDWQADRQLLEAYQADTTGTEIVAIETRQLDSAKAMQEFCSTVFVELPLDGDTANKIITLSNLGLFAKVRTGGLTADAFPSCEALASFISTCATQNLRFKATAGLHHPIRSRRAASDAMGAEKVTMHGFLNVLVATATAIIGDSSANIATLLSEESPEILLRNISYEDLQIARRLFCSIGTCSFEEPVTDLQDAGWLAL